MQGKTDLKSAIKPIKCNQAMSILLRTYHVLHAAYVLLSAFRLLDLSVKDTFSVSWKHVTPESQRHF